jgi:hypothetical protein
MQKLWVFEALLVIDLTQNQLGSLVLRWWTFPLPQVPMCNFLMSIAKTWLQKKSYQFLGSVLGSIVNTIIKTPKSKKDNLHIDILQFCSLSPTITLEDDILRDFQSANRMSNPFRRPIVFVKLEVSTIKTT